MKEFKFKDWLAEGTLGELCFVGVLHFVLFILFYFYQRHFFKAMIS